jgi:hypothetical protein
MFRGWFMVVPVLRLIHRCCQWAPRRNRGGRSHAQVQRTSILCAVQRRPLVLTA